MKISFREAIAQIRRKRLSKSTSTDHPLSTCASSSWNKKFISEEINTQLQKDINRANYNLIYSSIPNINALTTDIILVYFYNNDHLSYSQGLPDIVSFLIHLTDTKDKEIIYKKCESLLNALSFALDEEGTKNDTKLDSDLLSIHNFIINSNYLEDKYRPEISPSVYAKKWFKTLFVRHFNKELVEYIWMTYILDTNYDVQTNTYNNCLLCFCTILLSIRRKISSELEDNVLYSSEDALLTFMEPSLTLGKFKELKKEAEVMTKDCLNN